MSERTREIKDLTIWSGPIREILRYAKEDMMVAGVYWPRLTAFSDLLTVALGLRHADIHISVLNCWTRGVTDYRTALFKASIT